MIVAISASGPSLESPVDPRFGRAQCFIVFDTESGAFQPHGNTQQLNAAQGAGIQAAENVARLNASVVITGHCGPKAFRTLAAADIRVVTGAEGTVREAIAAFQSGALKSADAADVEGHWA